MDSNIDTAEPVSLEHDLAHLLSVLERVHRGLGEEDLASLGVDLELLEERKVPEMLHILPVLDDSILHGVRDLQHGAGGGGLVTTHDVLDYNVVEVFTLLLGTEDRPADYRGELVVGEVLSGIADLEEAGASIEDCTESMLAMRGRRRSRGEPEGQHACPVSGRRGALMVD